MSHDLCHPRRTAAGLTALLLALITVLTVASPAARADSGAPRALLVGQSNTGAWNDLAAATGASAQGGSVYYGVRDGGFSGACGSGCESDYADFLASRGKEIEVGVSWKDNPPGWDGYAPWSPTGARCPTGWWTARRRVSSAPDTTCRR
ncbi:hypothetical protein [Actinacidiphila alni]|uniref:hypothetical protein n=1 Tax=Actinacidiphila alni TaxID=380248 RepID=UPI0034518DB5